MNINLNLYKYFYEVAKYNSYTKAANELMISQPSLSYSVKVLENQLNTKLFAKNNNKIQLTESGKKIYERLQIVFSELDKINTTDEYISGILKIGVRSAYANRILPFYINELNKIYPDLKVEITVGNSKNLFKMLKDNDVDIIIDEYDYKSDNYISIPTNNALSSILFTSIDGYDRIKEIIDIDYFLKNDIYIVGVNKITGDMKKQYPDFKYIDVQSTAIMVNKIKENNGIGFTQLLLISEELENKTLIEIKPNFKLPESNVYVTHNAKIQNKKILAFSNFIKEHTK